MEKKYEFTGETKEYLGITPLHRIRYIKNGFSFPSERIGGWIQSEDNLSHEGNCGVFDEAMVCDDAKVSENARIWENAIIRNNALIYGNACIVDNSRVLDYAEISGNAILKDYVIIGGRVKVTGGVYLNGRIILYHDFIINKDFMSIRRSDSHLFHYLPCSDGEMRVSADCRYFTMKEAREHWSRTRGGTPLGKETEINLDALEKYAALDA